MHYIRSVNRMSGTDRMRVITALVEGSSVRFAVRMTGISIPTVLKLLADSGPVCARYQDERLRGLRSRRLQCIMHYNFARIHQTLSVTPAMAAGVSDHVWGIDEVVELLEATELDSEKAA